LLVGQRSDERIGVERHLLELLSELLDFPSHGEVGRRHTLRDSTG
jgi:hypothetical protein